MAASIAPECNEIKELVPAYPASTPHVDHLYRKYDTCFLKWYSESTYWELDSLRK